MFHTLEMISVLLYALVFVAPVLVALLLLRAGARASPRVVATTLLGSVLLALVSSYMPEIGQQIDVAHYEALGYDSGGMSKEERVRRLAPVAHADAEAAYWANSGVGWPLRAMLFGSLAALHAGFVMLLAGPPLKRHARRIRRKGRE